MTLMRTPLPALVATRLTGAGLDADACLRPFDLQRALIETHVVAEVQRLAEFYDAAAAHLGEPDLGLSLIDAIDRGAYGLAEFGIRAAPTIREATKRLARFSMLLNEATVVRLDETSDELRIHQRIPGYPQAGGRHANEYFIAVLHGSAQVMTERAFVATEVWFSHPAPPDQRRHRAVFGDARLRFDCADNGLSIPRSVTELPLRSADPALMLAIDRQAEQLLAARASEPDAIDVVRDATARALQDGPVSLADVAALLAMSPRTLQRRLGDHGTSFREVLDTLRRALHARLSAQGISSQQIAFRLGYADMGSFRRAQRRWSD